MVKKVIDFIEKTVNSYQSSFTAKPFEPEEQAKVFKQFMPSMNLVEDVPKSANQFNQYAKTHTTSVSAFAKVKLADGSAIGEKFKVDNQSVQNVKTSINEAFKLSDDLKIAQKNFNQNMASIKVLVDKKDPSVINSVSLAKNMAVFKGKAHEAIKAQHELETTNLTNLLSDPTFLTNLQTALEITDPADLEKVTKDMKKELETSQKNDLSNFEKQINDDITRLKKEAANDFDRLFILGDQSKNAEVMKAIRAAAAKRQGTDQNAGVDVIIDSKNPGSVLLRGLTPADVGMLNLLYNKGTFSRGPTQINQDGSISIELPATGLRSLATLFTKGTVQIPFAGKFYQWVGQQAENDLTVIALALKTSGNDSITFSITNTTDENNAIEDARYAYEACIRAGFPPEKIKIVVNEEVKSAVYEKDKDGNTKIKTEDKLFQSVTDKKGKVLIHGDPNRLATANQMAETYKKEREKWVEAMAASPEHMASIKEQLDALKASAPPQPAPPAGNAPPALGNN